MSNNQVDDKRIEEISGDIRNLSKNLQSTANEISEAANTAMNAVNAVNEYKGAYVYTGERTVVDEKAYVGSDGEKHSAKTHVEYGYAPVIINGTEIVAASCNEIKNQMDSIANEELFKLISQSDKSHDFAGYIAKKEHELNKLLEGNSADLMDAYKYLFATTGIASNAVDAKNNDMIPENAVSHNTDDWAGGIRFKKMENGTYLIYKIDKNGNEIAMGYTTAEGKRKFYQKALQSKNSGRGDNYEKLSTEGNKVSPMNPTEKNERLKADNRDGIDSTRFKLRDDGKYEGTKTGKIYTREEALKKSLEQMNPTEKNERLKADNRDGIDSTRFKLRDDGKYEGTKTGNIYTREEVLEKMKTKKS